MEPPEAALPAAQRPRAPGQEPGGEGRVHHGEAELPAVRHDHPPGDGQRAEDKVDQEGAGERARQVGERPAQDGEEDALSYFPCT